MGYRIVSRRTVADAYQDSRFLHGKVSCMLAEIVAAGSLHAVALVAIKIGIAVKLHNVRFGVLFFNLRGQQDFHNLTGEGLFLGQVCILNDLLGDGAPSLGDLSPVLHKSQSGAEGGNPVNARMALKAPVLLSNICVLNVHADAGNAHILVVSGIDKSYLAAVPVVNRGVGQLGKIRAFHLRQLVIGQFAALIQVRLDLGVNQQAQDGSHYESGCHYGQKGVEQPAGDAQKADSYVADHQQDFPCGLFQCIFHSPLYPLLSSLYLKSAQAKAYREMYICLPWKRCDIHGDGKLCQSGKH